MVQVLGVFRIVERAAQGQHSSFYDLIRSIQCVVVRVTWYGTWCGVENGLIISRLWQEFVQTSRGDMTALDGLDFLEPLSLHGKGRYGSDKPSQLDKVMGIMALLRITLNNQYFVCKDHDPLTVG